MLLRLLLPVCMRLLLMATLCVYRPRYSITCLGPPNGRLAYTTQFLMNKLSSKFLSSIFCALKHCTYFALNTLLIAFTENKYLLLRNCFCHWPCASTPPPGTMQCRCGCRLKFCPQVCNIDIIPSCTPAVAPNCLSVCHTLANKQSYTMFGRCKANVLSSCGRVNTT